MPIFNLSSQFVHPKSRKMRYNKVNACAQAHRLSIKPTTAKILMNDLTIARIFACFVSYDCKRRSRTSMYAPFFTVLLPRLVTHRNRSACAQVSAAPRWNPKDSRGLVALAKRCVARLLSGFLTVWQSIDFVNALSRIHRIRLNNYASFCKSASFSAASFSALRFCTLSRSST